MWIQKTRQSDISVYNYRVYGEEERGKGHSTGRPELSRVERGSARRCSSKGRERAIVSHMNIGTVSKATLGKHSRDGVERLSERIITFLN